MRNANAEIIKTDKKEAFDMEEFVAEAKMKVTNEQHEAAKAEDEARSLELELREAQVAHERKEEAEHQGKETTEKITELTG